MLMLYMLLSNLNNVSPDFKALLYEGLGLNAMWGEIHENCLVLTQSQLIAKACNVLKIALIKSDLSSLMAIKSQNMSETGRISIIEEEHRRWESF